LAGRPAGSTTVGASASATVLASASASAAPAAGPLTSERLIEVASSVKIGDDWATTEERLVRALGPASRELHGIGLVWTVPGQDDCTYFVARYSGDKVSEVVAPAKHGRAERFEFEDCFWYVELTPPDKDPNGAGPEPGKVYSVHEALAGLQTTRSKWVAQPIRIRGKTLGVVRSGPDDKHWMNASVNLADEKDPAVTIAAQVDQNVEAAPKDGQKIVITVEGTLEGHAGWLGHAKVVK
jgi:hypothetical protein